MSKLQDDPKVQSLLDKEITKAENAMKRLFRAAISDVHSELKEVHDEIEAGAGELKLAKKAMSNFARQLREKISTL